MQLGLDCGVIQPCSVYTGVSSLCQPQTSDTKTNVKMCLVCECTKMSEGHTSQPASAAFKVADNGLGKQSLLSGSQYGSSVNY